MSYMKHPALARLFDRADHLRVAQLREALSPTAIAAMRAAGGSILAPEPWRRLASLGLFRPALAPTGVPSAAAEARAVAMMADALEGDGMNEIGPPIRVQGLVVPHGLAAYADSVVVRDLAEQAAAGTVTCALEADLDPTMPTLGRAVDGGYRLTGRKGPSVNAPDAAFALVTFRVGPDRLTGVIGLSGEGVKVETLHPAGGAGLYSQGAVTFEAAFLPQAQVLGIGPGRAVMGDRVTALVRLSEAISAQRALRRLVDAVPEMLGHRPGTVPALRKWGASARARAAMLEGAIVFALREIAAGRFDAGAIAGLTARASASVQDLAREARTFAGGAGAPSECDIDRIIEAPVSLGISGEADVAPMALYGAGLVRRHPCARMGIAS